MRKNCSSDQEKLLKFEAEGREFLVTECFFNLFLEVSRIYKSEQIEFELKKILGSRNIQEKLEKVINNTC